MAAQDSMITTLKGAIAPISLIIFNIGTPHVILRDRLSHLQINFCFPPWPRHTGQAMNDLIADIPSECHILGMSDVSYIRVRWLHASPDEPVELWSELDAARDETRKVEIWADGRVGYASAESVSDGTILGECPVPAMEEIAADPQFQPEIISRSAFEECWSAHVR